MREILFRGKRKDNGEWVEGDMHRRTDRFGEHETIIFQDNGAGMFRKCIVDLETVCQYTELSDKNGKKIFEGDIVAYQYDNDDCPFPNKDTRKRIGRVFFQDWRASFAVAEGRNGSAMCNQDLFNYVRNGNRTEVIGNIYDNPDLISEEGK